MGLLLPVTVQQVVESTSASHTALHGHWLQVTAGAYWRQLPLTHISSRAQVSPQSPQFSGSVSVSTHARRPLPTLHSVRPLAQPPFAAEHVPVWHFWFWLHAALSQAPQWFTLLFRSTQVPLQSVRPSRQTHFPAEHIWLSAHLVPHLPHWSGSFCKSEQVPLQSVRPASQRHLPPPQVSNNALQAMLHWPQ
jgi:hypothetical protein